MPDVQLELECPFVDDNGPQNRILFDVNMQKQLWLE